MMIWALLLVLAVCVAAGVFLPRLGWPTEIAVSLLPQFGALALLLTLSLFLLGRPVDAVAAMALAALCAYGARDLFAPPTPPLAQRDVRIVWANLLGETDAFARVMRFAASQEADLVVLAEFPPGISADEARPLAGAYTHIAGRPAHADMKVAIFSSLPLSDIESVAAPWHGEQLGLAAAIATPSGALRIIGLHPPVPYTPGAQRARDAAIAAAMQQLRTQGPSVLMGDFNTVSWSPAISGALADGAVTRAQTGVMSTWASPLPVLGLPIDHVFGANGAHISARIGPGIGSDHLPLTIDVVQPR